MRETTKAFQRSILLVFTEQHNSIRI